MAAARDNYADLGATPLDNYSDLGAQPVSAPASQKTSSPQEMASSQNPIDPSIVEGFAQGLANIVPGAQNLGANIANAFGANIPLMKQFNFAPDDKAASLGNAASFFAAGPLAKGAAELSGITKGINAIPGIGSAIDAAGNAMSKYPITTSAAKNALLGAVYNPQNEVLSGAIGGALGAAAPLVAGGYNALRPSVALRGTLSPEELQHNLDVTQGTQTDLGNVLQNPLLKKVYENVLTNIPLTGANKTMQENANVIATRGHNILDSLLGSNNPEDVNQTLSDTLQNVYKNRRAEKNALYDQVNQQADKAGLQIELPTFSKLASDYSDAIGSTNILKFEPDMARLMSKLQNYKNPTEVSQVPGKIIDEFGNPLISDTKTSAPSLQEANVLKGLLREYSNKFSQSADSGDRASAGIFGKLSGALKSDIQDSIENSGDESLQGLYKNAEDNYKKNFSPFLDKQIYKYATGQKDPDLLLSDFVKTSRTNDRGNLLNKLVSQLPAEQKNMVGYGYLSKSLDKEGNINPLTMSSLINKLGSKQFEAMFPNEETRNVLSDYADLTGKNTNALTNMVNPRTGQTGLIPLLWKAPAALAGKALGGRWLTNKLTDPAFRESLVNKMLENSKQGK